MRYFGVAATVSAVAMAALIAMAADGPAPPMSERWEYKVMSADELAGVPDGVPREQARDRQSMKRLEAAALKHLSQLGAEGWQLIEFNDDDFYFSRRLGN